MPPPVPPKRGSLWSLIQWSLAAAWLLEEYVGAHGACLPDAIPAEKQIVVDDVTMPLGIWPLGWDSSILAANVMRIIAEEVLGFAVNFGPGDAKAASSHTAIRVLAGCRVTEDAVENCLADEPKELTVRRYHLSFETWTRSSLKAAPEETKPISLGLMGYFGSRGPHVQASTAARAMSQTGMSLLYYGHYNATWFNPARAFTAITNIGTRHLHSCSDEELKKPVGDYFPTYDAIYGKDEEGLGYVKQGDATYSLLCHNQTWWLSRACRLFPDRCIPYVLNERGYGLTEILLKSAFYNLPVAIGFARSAALLAEVVAQHDVLLYAYWPDLLPLAAGLLAISFPTYGQLSEQGYNISPDQTYFTTDSRELEKWASKGLQQQAGTAFEVARRMVISVAGMKGMLTDVVSGASHYQAACDWLRRDPAWRGEWIPSCPIGHFASGDLESETTLCKPCPKGQFGDSTQADVCSLCPLGHFASQLGSTACEPCPKGSYGDSPGAEYCESCSWWETTPSVGATESVHCTINPVVVLVSSGVVLLWLPALVGIVVHWHHKRTQLQKGMKRALMKGFDAITELQHPMCVVKLEDFCNMSLEDISGCHEGLRIAGQIHFLDTLKSVEEFGKTGRRILFFSYTWLSWNRRGPNELQLECMKDAAHRICKVNGEDISSMYIWLDVLAIPQINSRCKALAVDSLFNYASMTDYLVAICPDGFHEDSAEPVGCESYKSRVWCRVEQVAHASTRGLKGMYYTQEPGHLDRMDEDWVSEVIRIFAGHTTCCRLGHPGDRTCDRELLVPTLLAMYAKLLLVMNQTDKRVSVSMQMFWLLIERSPESIFPKTFIYAKADGTSEERPLFGPLVRWIREIATDSEGIQKVLEQSAAYAKRPTGIMTVGSYQSMNKSVASFARSLSLSH
eukprot:TRINITY_DN8499_c0_g1_i1.p1 TRINITY_DN8499_c0_g1~~TRINITY_DN8499_c0_g1_i1.p1  ORF type:complete len:907 (-),score=108.99 TRINITY_DN8499_c0_g1_i1:120-2840(-)